jgi:hypothetical protein
MVHYLSILAALHSLPIYKEDQGNLEAKRAQLETHAKSISYAVGEHSPRWPGTPEELAAVTVTIGDAESGYSLRIQQGDCHTWECDRGRARGTYQLQVGAVQGQDHRLWVALPGLDVGSVELSTDQAVRAIVRSRKQCGSLERAGKDWVGMTFHAYARSTCIGTIKGLDERVRMYHRVLAKILKGRIKTDWWWEETSPTEV